MRMGRRVTRGITALALAVGLAAGGMFGAGSATAAATAPAIATDESPPPGYEYAGEFFWHSSCVEAGNAGMNRGWSHYVCLGETFSTDYYELWIRPKR